MLLSIHNLVSHLRPADLVDVAIVALLLYPALDWLRTRASRALFAGVLGAVGLFLLSRGLNLYLTEVLFRAGLTVVVLVLVVVFQQDIRDAFERAVSWRKLRQDRQVNPSVQTIDTLVESASALAEQRTGALIALKGREHLERHLQGGIRVGGGISVPLLCSIFDPHSPGHDGAAVIENHQLELFGAHLPLSRKQAQVNQGGTRHLAALGLAERSDALVLVVSEERGSISIAEGGQIDPIATSEELMRRLERFYERIVPSEEHPAWRSALLYNLPLKLASLAVAVVLWLVLAYRVESVQETYTVPVEYRSIPADMAINGHEPATIRVTLSGPERAFDSIVAGELRMVVDLSDIAEGRHTIPLNQDDVRREPGLPLPADVSVNEIDPRTVPIEAFRLQDIEVPVRAWPVGSLPNGLVLESIAVQPPAVELRVRSTDAGQIEEIYTEPIKLSRITATETIRAELILPRHTRLADQESHTVQVNVRLRGSERGGG